jgi:DNA-binding transcriptional LysR family regulator
MAIVVDKLFAMRVFLQVADRGSFTAAADGLDLSRANVTRQVAALETALGVRLLNRTTRSLSLTGEGEEYRERCRRIVAEIDEAERVFAEAATKPLGRLRISAPTSFGSFQLAPAVAAFQDRYPDVTVQLVLQDRDVDLAAEGIDVSVHVGPVDDARLVARPVGAAELVVCGAPRYFAKRGRPRVPGDLERHNCLRYAYRPPQWRFARGNRVTSVTVSGDLQCNLGDALRTAAVAGRGVVLLPSYMVGEDLRAGRLLRVLADYRMAPVPICAVFLQRRHLPAKVRTFVEFLRQAWAHALADPGAWSG